MTMISLVQLVELFKANLAGIVAAIVVCPAAIWLSKRQGLLDVPGKEDHKRHDRPTPIAGGIVLVVCAGFLLSVFHLWHAPFLPIMIGAAVIFIFGLVDDARGLSVPVKFLSQVLASIILITSGVSVRFLQGFQITFISPFLINILQWLITLLWLVGITNSINFIDSMDGLAAGISGIAFTFFMGMALVARQAELSLFSAIFLGICIGIFIFNTTPARLFLGDSGAQTLGFILAAVAILYVPEKLPQGSSWFVPIMVLGVPIFDMVLVVVSRLRRHRSIFQADCAHTYHRLVALGCDPNRAVLIIHLAALVLNFLAFIALTLSPAPATIIFGLSVLAFLLLLVFLEYKNPAAESMKRPALTKASERKRI